MTYLMALFMAMLAYYNILLFQNTDLTFHTRASRIMWRLITGATAAACIAIAVYALTIT